MCTQVTGQTKDGKLICPLCNETVAPGGFHTCNGATRKVLIELPPGREASQMETLFASRG
jgi:hypothetical protein